MAEFLNADLHRLLTGEYFPIHSEPYLKEIENALKKLSEKDRSKIYGIIKVLYPEVLS